MTRSSRWLTLVAIFCAPWVPMSDLIAQVGSMRATVPSPAAASLGKFGDVPVSLYTGVPDINIPLFTATGRTLALPIALKYHAAGIRVEELGGWAGIGWALDAGGTITRSVRGLVDESMAGYFNTGHTFWNSGNWPNPPQTLVDAIRNRYVDGDPDQFFFSFAGRSGQFVVGPTSSSTTVKDYRAIPHQKLRIEPTSGWTAWVITTEDGTRYTFGAAEATTDLGQTFPSNQMPDNYGEGYISSWHLTEIRSVGGDVITLSYAPYTVRHRVGRYSEKFAQVVSPPDQPACVPSYTDAIHENEIAAQRLVSITSAAHVITFMTGSTLRNDARSPDGTAQEPRLDKITVATPTGTVLRVFQLAHDYSTGRLTLTSVQEQDRNGASLPPYTFLYNGGLPAVNSFAQDHWGYFNGKTANTTLVPAGITSSGVALSGADRSPSAADMQVGALTRVTYPTGGYNEFVYEPNSYGSVGDTEITITEEGPTQWAEARSYEFQGIQSTNFTVGGTDSVIATVTITLDPDCGTMTGCPYAELTGRGIWHTSGTHQVTLPPGTHTAIASEEYNLNGFAMISVSWKEQVPVKKKMAGALRLAELRTGDAMGGVTTKKYKYTLQSDSARSSGVISVQPDYDYSYSSPQCSYYSRSSTSKMPLGNGPPVGYKEVTVWHGTNGEYGKTRHTFRSAAEMSDPAPPSVVWPFSQRTSYEWMRGQQLGVTEYNSSGQPQQRHASTYAFRNWAPIDTMTTRKFRGLSINYFSAGAAGSSYVWNAYEVISAWTYQDSDTTVIYDDAGSSSFSTARSYVYGNSKHLRLTEQTETNSDGTQRLTRMKYPADYGTGSGNAEAAALAEMQGVAHIHDPVIEHSVIQRVGSTDSVVRATLTTFKQYGTGQYLPYQQFVLKSPTPLTTFVPSAVSGGSFVRDARYLLQETADNYDAHGRVTQLTAARGNLIGYEYGGNANSAFLTKVTQFGGAGSPDLITDVAYDTDGLVSSIKDDGGTYRYFTYDLFARLRQIKNHGGAVVKAFGYTYSRTGPSWTFNAASPNLVVDTVFLQHSPSSRSVVSSSYIDGLGRPIQSVVQDGAAYVVTSTQYDAMGRTWRNWKPYSRTTAGYDANFTANATSYYNTYHSSSAAKPYSETAYTADALSRVKQETPAYIGASPTISKLYSYGVDPVVKHEYTEATDETGKKTRGYVDVFGNNVKTILGYGSAEATTTHFLSDVTGARVRTTDPRSLVTTYAFDTRGLLVSTTSPDAGTVRSMHDVAGNVRYTQDANQTAAGQVHFTSYDVFGRPAISGQGAATFTALDPDAASQPALETTQGNWLTLRAYDGKPSAAAFPWSLFATEITPLSLSGTAGRLAAIASKSNGAWQATLFSYDPDGRVATRYTFTQANGGAAVLGAVNTTVTYVRDLRDAVTERWLTVGASTFNHWYDYDNRGLLWKVFAATGSTKPGTPDVIYTYRPSGQLQDRQFLGGPLVPMRYGIREQLEKIGDPAGTLYPFSARYAYYANGLVSEAEFYNAGSPAAAKRYRYQFPTYDALHRLKSADFSSWSGSSWTTTSAHDLAGINYDVSGNLTALQRRRETGTLIDNLTYAYPSSSNRLSSVSDAVGSTSESWDAETGSFSYDGNGNVLTAPAPYSISSISYDHQNLPLSITRSGASTVYRYDATGQRIVKQVGTGGTEVSVLDGSVSLGVVTVSATGAPSAWHFNLLAGDRVVGRQPSTGSRRYYHTDLLGSTRSVVQGTIVVESNDLDPWGLPMPGRALSSGTKEIFTGKERDLETGLDYFGARYYMPALGRWTTGDPQAEQLPEWSPYNYALNNPNSVVDPDGELPIWAVGALVGVGVEIGTQVWENRSKGMSFSEAIAIRNLDVSDIGVAAAFGAATGGLGYVQKAGSLIKAGKLVATAAAGATEGSIKAHTGTDQKTYSATAAVIDALTPALAGYAGELGAKVAKASAKGRALAGAAGRATNIATDGRPRPKQTRTAVAAVKQANKYGEGGVAKATEGAAVGIATTVAKGGDTAPPPSRPPSVLTAPDQTRTPHVRVVPP